MQKNKLRYIKPLPEIGNESVVCLMRAIESFGKNASLFSLRLDSDRYGSNADGLIAILKQYGINGKASSMTADKLVDKAPCMVMTSSGFLFLERVKDGYTAIDSMGRKRLSTDEFNSLYLGQVIELSAESGFNLTEEHPFSTIKTLSEVKRANKLCAFTVSFCCIAAILLAATLACILKAFTEECVIGNADGISMGATYLFIGTFVVLLITAIAARKIRRSLVSSYTSAINELAADHANKTDPAIYSLCSKKELLKDVENAANACANSYSSYTYAIWGIGSAAVFCALSFLLNPICAIPVGVALLLFAAILVVSRFTGTKKYILPVTAAASYIAVIGVIGISAFMSSSGVTAADMGALAIYALLFAFSSIFSAKLLGDEEKMKLAADFCDAFMNTKAFVSEKSPLKDYTISFKNASISSGGKILVSGLDFTVNQGSLTVIKGKNTSAVLKAAAGICFDVNGTRTLGGFPYSQVGDILINDVAFTEECGIKSGSVIDNIRRFDESIPSASVYKAARTLNMTDKIMKSLGSFEFHVTDGGKNISDTLQCGIMLCSLLLRKPKYAFIAKEALPADRITVSEMLRTLTKNGITVVTDKIVDSSDKTIELNEKAGGKRNG